MLEAGLQQLLVADPTLNGLIGTRVYPVVWPDDPMFPLTTYQRISTVTESVFAGPTSLVTCRIQFDVWSKTYADAKTIALALNAVLEGYVGVLPNGTQVVNITLDSAFDLYDSTSLAFRVSSDYLVAFYR